MDLQDILLLAELVHETNRAYIIDSAYVYVPDGWRQLSDEERDELIDTVKKITSNPTIEAWEVHESWLRRRCHSGWTEGETHNKDLRTHPWLRSYEELPASVRCVSHLSVAQVRAWMASRNALDRAREATND